MAGGKTFHGLGEIESAFRDDTSDGEDVRGVYSGPTVVDDDKVEEGLKKLRSLDQPPGPLTGVTEVVVDSSSSAKTQIAQLPAQGRPTAVGHSLGTPQVGQTISSDPLRGTMFGHSIHLPDVNTPDDVGEELSSGALMVTEASAPHALGPFPLADGATRPQGALVPRAEPLRLAGDGGLLPQAEPFRRPNKNFRIPEDTTDQLAPPRSKTAQRIALTFVAAGLAAAGFVVWQQVHEGGLEPDPAPRAVTADPAPAPAAEPAAPAAAAAAATEGAPNPTAPAAPSPAAAAQPPGEAEPTSAAKPASAPSPRQRSSSRTTAAATEDKAPAPAVEEPAAAAAPAAAEPAATTAEEETPAITPKPALRPGRRRGSRAAADDDQPAPSKPARSAKPKVEEDPDATLPPSLD